MMQGAMAVDDDDTHPRKLLIVEAEHLIHILICTHANEEYRTILLLRVVLLRL